jgi:hypothetical protein
MGEMQNLTTGEPTRTEPTQGKRLLDRAGDALRAAGFEQGAANRYVGWMGRNGREMAAPLRDRSRNALRVGQYALDTEHNQLDSATFL